MVDVTTPWSTTATGVEFVNDVVLVGMACGSAVIASDQPLSVPVLPAVSSETRRVHVPFGSSPMKAPSGSSGVRLGTTTLFAYTWSVTIPSFVSYGTSPLGSASSLQVVPLKTFALAPPLSVVSVTTVPDGDVIVTSRSWLLACCRNVVTSTWIRYELSPLTTMVDVVSPLSVSAVDAEFWKTCGVPVHATGMVVEVDVDVELDVVDDEVELEVDELVELDVDDEVEDDVDEDVELVDVLVVVDDDVLVVVEWVVDVEVEVEVLVVLDLVVEVELDVLLDVVELDVLVDVLVDDVVVVAKSHPMSLIRSRASDGSVMSVV